MRSSANSANNPNDESPKEDDENQNMVATIAREFAEMTCIHGMKFIAKRNSSLPERMLWVVLVLIGICFAVVFTATLWANWDKYPVLITVKSANYPIAERHSFPSVTICSVNRVSAHAFGKWFASQGKGLKLDIQQAWQTLKIIATSQYEREDNLRILNKLLEKSNFTSDNNYYEKVMELLTPSCSEMVVYCSWEGKEEDCTMAKFIERESTDRGYCCSFNSVILHKDGTTNEKVLRYARQSGSFAGMTIILDAQMNDYNVTASDTSGFKVSIQSPDSFSTASRTGFLISPGRQYDIAITGETQTAPKSIESIPLSKRVCALDDEIKLRYFSHYSSNYCMLDCLANILLERCKCVLYFFPVPEDLPVCNLGSYICVKKAMDYQILNVSACFCPEKCNHTWYKNEATLGVYPNPVSKYPQSILKRAPFNRMNSTEFQKYAQNNFVQMNIYFKSMTGVAHLASHRTAWKDFIAATGGLFGLGCGVSLLSFAEIFYFVFIRWTYHYFERRKKKRRQAALMRRLQRALPRNN